MITEAIKQIKAIARILFYDTLRAHNDYSGYKIWIAYQSIVLFMGFVSIFLLDQITFQAIIALTSKIYLLISSVISTILIKRFPGMTIIIGVISFVQLTLFISEPYFSINSNINYFMADITTAGIFATVIIYDSFSTIFQSIVMETLYFLYSILTLAFRSEFKAIYSQLIPTIGYALYGYCVSLAICGFFLFDRYKTLIADLENKKLIKSWKEVNNHLGIAVSIEKEDEIIFRNKQFTESLHITDSCSAFFDYSTSYSANRRSTNQSLKRESSIFKSSSVVELEQPKQCRWNYVHNGREYNVFKKRIYISHSVCSIFIAHDITKLRKEEESKFSQLLVATVTHELRTPLNIISHLFNNILEQECSLEIKESVKKGLMATMIQENLINDILDVAKLNSGKFQLNPQITNIKKVTIDLYNLLKMNISNRVEFIIQFGSSFPEKVMIDERRYKQIVMNLVSNSIKFTKAGQIIIKISYKNGSIICSVSDTGAGIPESMKPNIFKKFCSSQSSLNINGTGLGLNLCKSLVEEMGGSISFESTENKCSTFYFSIPCDDTDCNPFSLIPVSQTKAILAPKETLKVCNIDDELLNLSILENYALKFGIQCVSFKDPAEAIDNIFSCSVAFIDLHMPGMTGYECVRKIKVRNKLIIAIAITGDDKELIMKECQEAGFDETLEKPLRYEEYKAIMNKYI